MKKKLLITSAVFAVVAIVGGVMQLNIPSRNTIAVAQDILHHEISIERMDLARTFSTSGVVRSADSHYVFSTHNRPVKGIQVRVGDRVNAGDVLAILDMSTIENDLAQTQQNLLNAQRSVSDEERNNSNTITNAQTSLDSARISLERQNNSLLNAERDLEEAQADLYAPFDSYHHDRAIIDARINLDRRIEAFSEAQNDLLNSFDDYHHQNAINEAQITLNRRLSELNDARNDLNEEQRNRIEPFDNAQLQNAVADAERNLDRRREDEHTAQSNLHNAWNLMFLSPPEQADTTQQSLTTAQTNAANARRAVEDAELALERARNEETRARENHNDNKTEIRDNAINAAERTFNNAQNAADDAQRTLDRAISDLNRAKSDAETSASNNLTTALNNLNDAQRNYERAKSDRQRAEEDNLIANENRLITAQRNLNDNKNQLASAQNSLSSAQNTLNQATNRPSASETSVEIQMLNLDRLTTQLEEGKILAPTSGVVTEINASIGAAASGVLFVIEDTENLYVSANVREHTLRDLQIGQAAFVTTEITGNHNYDAQLTFISPRSVSPVGSTNVEFEIHATMNESDKDVRIGMNAFINVIIDYVNNAFAVPLSAIIDTERGSFISVLEDETIRPIPVTVGLRTSTHAEINADELYDGKNILAMPNLAAMGRGEGQREMSREGAMQGQFPGMRIAPGGGGMPVMRVGGGN